MNETEVKVSSPVDSAIHRLSQNVDSALSVVQMLAERLTPVLSEPDDLPISPEYEGEKAVLVDLCDIELDLAGITENVICIGENISAILEKLRI